MITSSRTPGAVHPPAVAKSSAQRPQALMFSCSNEPKDTYRVRFAEGKTSQAPAENETHKNELDDLIRGSQKHVAHVAMISKIRQTKKDSSNEAPISNLYIEHGKNLFAQILSLGESFFGQKD